MSERMVNPYMELSVSTDASEYAAQVADNLGWVKVAGRIRKHGWIESSEDLIGRIERAMTWKGHWKESRLRLVAARDVLAVLTSPIGVELLPYCIDLNALVDPNVHVPITIRQWLDAPEPRAVARHPTLGWMGLIANGDAQRVDVVSLGEQP